MEGQPAPAAVRQGYHVSLATIEGMRGSVVLGAARAIGRFLLWVLVGYVCPQCGTRRTTKHFRRYWVGGDEFCEYVCPQCMAENSREYWARREAREREQRIDEMAEAIRRSCPAAKKRARRGR